MLGLSLSIPGVAARGQGLRTIPTLDLDFLSGNLDSRIAFSRASMAWMTNSTGTIVTAPHNLLTDSQSFDAAAWTKTRTTVTGNVAAAPDGTTTADKVVEATDVASSRNVQQSYSVTSGVTYGLSIYAKAAERSAINLRPGNGFAAGNVTFDLFAGTLTNTGAVVASSITAAGSGWYRCFAAFAATSSTTGAAQILLSSGGVVIYDGVAGNGVYLWGAQLEQHTALRDYLSTSVKNLLGFSEQFDNAAWTKSNATISANAAASPDGTLTADKLVESAVTIAHYVEQSVTGVASTYAGSIYAKAGERTRITAYLVDGGGIVAGTSTVFDLSNGTTVQGTGTISSVGNGWYRCAVVGLPAAGTLRLRVLLTVGVGTSYTSDGTSGLFLWGAQLSSSSSVDAYSPVASAAPTSAAYHGPRFDYDPVTLAAKGLLIEESRVNLRTTSDDMATVFATQEGCTFSANAAVSPDGATTADKMVEDGTTGNHRLRSGVTVASVATVHTSSIYIKAAGRTSVTLILSDSTSTVANNIAVVANLSAGTIGSVSVAGTGVSGGASISAVGNGWYRVSLTGNFASGTTFATWLALGSYAGDSSSGVLLWGAQLEAGSFPTSYIPTTASTVTRAADVCSMPVPAVPTRTNLLLRSAEFDNAAWVAGSNGGAVVTADSGTAPDGTTTADTLNDNNAVSATGKAQSITITSGSGYYTASVYMKAGTSSVASLNMTLSGGTLVSGQAVINLATGAAQWRTANAGFSFAVTDAGGGWYRAAVTVADNASGNTVCAVEIRPAFAATYSPTMSAAAQGAILVWGAQLETGSTASAYIPTTTAAVTAADTTSWYNASAGTLFVEFQRAGIATGSLPRVASFSDGTLNNLIEHLWSVNDQFSIAAGGVNQAIQAGINGGTALNRQAGAWATNDVMAYLNGAALGVVDTVATIPTGITALQIGNRVDLTTQRQFSGWVRKIRYYNSRLPDASLQQITT
jgi:hypothetical protein